MNLFDKNCLDIKAYKYSVSIPLHIALIMYAHVNKIFLQ